MGLIRCLVLCLLGGLLGGAFLVGTLLLSPFLLSPFLLSLLLLSLFLLSLLLLGLFLLGLLLLGLLLLGLLLCCLFLRFPLLLSLGRTLLLGLLFFRTSHCLCIVLLGHSIGRRRKGRCTLVLC